MIHTIFTVYDVKADAYLPPFILPTTPMAERTFIDCCTRLDHQFGAHPEDYVLFSLGQFDDSKASFDIHIAPLVVLTGLQAQATNPPPNTQQVDIEDLTNGKEP